MTYEDLLPSIIAKQLVVVTPGWIYQSPFPKWYNPNATYAYHGRTPGHSVDIAQPEVQAQTITYPPSLIQLIQSNFFHGLPNEDPYAHLATYIEICNTIRLAGVPADAIRLSLLSFSLSGEAKRWLHSFKGNSLKSWDEVVEKFLKKYFPESKTAEGKAAISSFHQFPDESLSEALERFRGLLRKTPTHGFSEPIQLNIFIDELRPESKQLVDASVGGKIKMKTPDEAMDLIESMAASDIAILRDRAHIPTKKSLLELTSQDTLLAQNKLLSKQLETLTKTLSKLPTQLHSAQTSHSSILQVTGCTIFGEAHESGCCIPNEEQIAHEVNYMRDQGGSSKRAQQQMLSLYDRTTKLEETLAQFMQVSMSNQKSIESAIKNLEVQVGQLAK
ncbi:uncharacterized protein [Glycine max]|uniref:uncharacterized protein n=1 Tax=Glycine max TaxID=3847 RepID=UPI0003DED592|nr:uncharacterized protein LOC102661083 [Glycine max]|eukprot:XP_006599870.1 uncharacterized protein LOC102661083 [Glycine max]